MIMAWFRLDDTFPEHPKVLTAGPEAAWLLVCSIGYANRNLTDGFVPEGALHLFPFRRPSPLVERLVSAGLWEPVPGGWVVHDFLDYQTSRAKVEQVRAQARERWNRRGGSPPAPEVNGATSAQLRAKGSAVARNTPRARDTDRDTDTSELTDRQTDSTSALNGSPSSVDELIKVSALALGMKDRQSPTPRYVAGIERNLRAERMAEALKLDQQHLTLEAKVTRLCGDGTYARLALEAHR